MRALLAHAPLEAFATDAPIAAGLREAGLTLTVVHTAADAADELLTDAHDVVVLGVLLPDCCVFELIKTIRTKRRPVGIIVMLPSPHAAAAAKLLRAGADSVVAATMEREEIAAIALAVCRRCQGGHASNLLRSGVVSFDLETRQTLVAGRPVALSRRETDILETLMLRAGRIVAAESIEARVWADDIPKATSLLRVHIHGIRRKLGAVGVPSGWIWAARHERGYGVPRASDVL